MLLFLQLISFAILSNASAQAELAPGTPVKLLADLPKGENKIWKCGPAKAGRTGVIVKSHSSRETFVHWDKIPKKECALWEQRGYVDLGMLQATGPATPLKDKTDKCAHYQFGENETRKDQLQKAFLAFESESKTNAEVEKYLSCYPTKNYQAYVSKYKFMIETAAAEFAVDASLMKCLLAREGAWDSQMVSCTCATGIGQQVMENINEIDKKIGSSSERVQNGTVANTELPRAWDSYMQKIRGKDPSLLAGCSGNFKYSNPVKANSDFYKEAISHREKGCQSSSACAIYQQDDRRCGPASIAATAAYLRLVDKALQTALTCGQIEEWQVYDIKLAIALAYNSGEGIAIKALDKQSQIQHISKSILKHAQVDDGKKREMQGHFTAINNCLEKGNTKAPWLGGKENKVCFGKSVQAGLQGTAGAGH